MGSAQSSDRTVILHAKVHLAPFRVRQTDDSRHQITIRERLEIAFEFDCQTLAIGHELCHRTNPFSATGALASQWESSVLVSPIKAPALMILDEYGAEDRCRFRTLGFSRFAILGPRKHVTIGSPSADA